MTEKPLSSQIDPVARFRQKCVCIEQSLKQHAELLALLAMAVGVFFFAREYLDPRLYGFPFGHDSAADLGYVGELRNELLSSGRLLTWYSVAYDGMPLLGHPLTHVFYPILTLPIITMGVETGLRIAYASSLLLAAAGMYSLARVLGARPIISSTVGMLFVMSGTLTARIIAGQVERVLAIPLIPWVFVAIILAGRSQTTRLAGLWAMLAGLLTGLVFLAGDSYLLLFLLVTIPPVLCVIAKSQGIQQSTRRFLLAIFCWLTGVLVATSAKLLAGLDLVSSSPRSVDPFLASQDWYWSVMHLVYPFLASGPILPGQAPPEQTYAQIPGPVADYYFWEFTQYIGVIPVIIAIWTTLLFLLSVIKRNPAFRGICRGREITALLIIFLIAALWLADGYPYSPFHWLYLFFPPLQQFRVPSRALMQTAPAALSLAAIGFETLFRLAERKKWFSRLLVAMLIAALADTYLITNWIPRLVIPAGFEDAHSIATMLRHLDPGPFVVDTSNLMPSERTSATWQLAQSGIRIADTLTPLVPRFQDHKVIGASDRIRYSVTVAGQEPLMPGSWHVLSHVGTLTVYINSQADGDAWLVSENKVSPLRLNDSQPTSFSVQVAAKPGEMVVVPANAFQGWSVQVDQGPPMAAAEFDGYVAYPAEPGQHTYHFIFEPPMLPLILGLALAPWILGGVVIASLFVGRLSRVERRVLPGMACMGG
jgi:hypothetical protein